MAILGIDHVAIAVRSLEDARENYRRLIPDEPHEETVEQQGVRLCAFEAGDSRIELIEPLSEDNAIGKFLDKHGEGLHHVALRTNSIDDELDRVRDEENLPCIDEEPREGAEGYRIAFLHPGELNGTLVELAQPPLSD